MATGRRLRIAMTGLGAARLLVLLCCVGAAPASAGEGQARPQRVVSMNLCTDQLAMLVAGEGQLHSVSHLATDPQASVLADEAGQYVANHGLAEEIFLIKPDLVIAGTYSTRTTIGLLRRLGIRVEEFAPASSFEDIRRNLERMGELLGHKARADLLIRRMNEELEELAAPMESEVTIAAYYRNSYVSGSGTLVDEAFGKAGLTNIAGSMGLRGTVRLPLELLVMARPDLIMTDAEAEARSGNHQSEAVLVHPAFRRLADKSMHVNVPTRYTVCGTPFTVEAVRLLRDAARRARR